MSNLLAALREIVSREWSDGDHYEHLRVTSCDDANLDYYGPAIIYNGALKWVMAEIDMLTASADLGRPRRDTTEIERIEALRSNALMMIEHSEAQAARSYWMGQQSAFDAALSVLRDPWRSTETQADRMAAAVDRASAQVASWPRGFQPARRSTETPRTEPLCCSYCGSLGWTVETWGRLTHKEACPHRVDPWSQTHPGVALCVNCGQPESEHVHRGAEFVCYPGDSTYSTEGTS